MQNQATVVPESGRRATPMNPGMTLLRLCGAAALGLLALDAYGQDHHDGAGSHGQGGRPSAAQCRTGTSPLAMANKLVKRDSEAKRS